jgi:predicted transcriptional regulator
MAKSRQAVTDAEMAVLRVLWDRGPLTAREITAAIYPDGGETEFASVHSFLQRLERKGLVERDRSGFVHVFSAAASQADVAGQELEALADKLSGGSLAPFLMHLVQRQRLTDHEASEIRSLLDTYKSPNSPRGKKGRRRSS